MFIDVLKFFHLLFTLSLLGSALVCLVVVGSKKFAHVELANRQTVLQLNKWMLKIAGLAMLTGTFLVYPKHFTFHTPWIQAAYILVFVFCMSITVLVLFRDRLKHRWLLRGIYLFLILLLIGVVHDAVTKSTFLF